MPVTQAGGAAVVVVGDVPGSPTGLEHGPYNWPPLPVGWLSEEARDLDVLVVVGESPLNVVDAARGVPEGDAVVVVVGNHRVPDRVALLNRGVHDVVGTPVAPDELAARIARATRTRQLSRQLDAALQSARDANRRLERFAHRASHDLTEPLRAVSGFAKLLNERYADVLDDTGKTYLSFILDGSSRLSSMIGALLELSRLTRHQIRPREVSLEAAVGGVLSRMESELTATGTTVDVVVDSIPTIFTDQELLEVCLRHLLSNAAKFVSSDRDPVVTVRGEVSRPWVKVTIEDNGIGVATEHLDRVFDMFSRLNGRERFAGHGIGLGVVSLVAQRLGGEVSMDSELGGGTRVTLRLPAVGPPPSDRAAD